MLPGDDKVFLLTDSIQRKVTLYDCGNNVATVVDYMRRLRTLPYELVVPVYPEQDDMLLIQGEEPGDVWHGKAVSINGERNEVDVYFSIEKQHEPNKFVCETSGRLARNTVSFDSVIAVATGRWINANCWQKNIESLHSSKNNGTIYYYKVVRSVLTNFFITFFCGCFVSSMKYVTSMPICVTFCVKTGKCDIK